MKASQILRYLALALVLGSASSCSFVFVHGPPSGFEQMDSFSCTESYFVPVLDFVGVGSSVIGAVTAEDEPGLFEEGGSLFALDKETQIAGNLAFGAVLAASAVAGLRRVNHCRAAREALMRRSDELASQSAERFQLAR